MKPLAHACIGGIVLLCCCAAPTHVSAAPTAASAPEIRVDDTWTYRILDGFTHETQGEVTQRVVGVRESEIVTQLRTSKNDKTRRAHSTPTESTSNWKRAVRMPILF